MTRRKWITAGLASTAGLAAAARIANQYGLVPPDHGGLYGPGHALTYASQRLITSHSMAREFSPSQITKTPFANGAPLEAGKYRQMQSDGVKLDGLVARPISLTVEELKRFSTYSQITHLACEEGWSFIAQWTGARLSEVLAAAGIKPEARFVVYSSIDGWTDSIDMADVLHPQTLLTYGMNGSDLPMRHGGPIRMRVPRQLGYKSMKYLTRITVTDSLKDHFQASDYSWYAGI